MTNPKIICVFVVMNDFCKVNMKLSVKDVKDFYVRNGLAARDERGMIDICVAIDGTVRRNTFLMYLCFSFTRCF